MLVGDERKGGTRASIEDFADWLRGQVDTVTVVLDRDESLEHHESDLVVVLGGDGSMLATARRMGSNQAPTLGINLGRLGFLTAFRHDQAREAVGMALRGELVEERRMMLTCHVQREGGEMTPPVLCLNDGVLTRAASAGIVVITAERVGRELATYSGDGVIVATAIGSTAYSLAAGGPVITPNLDALVLTSLAPHSLTVRPLVVPSQDGLDLVVKEGGGESNCALVVDGQVSLEVAVGERVCLRPSDVEFLHLTRGPDSFFEILREKFGWADTPRQRVRDLGGADTPLPESDQVE